MSRSQLLDPADRILPSSPIRQISNTVDRSPARPLITAVKFNVKVSLTLDPIFSGIETRDPVAASECRGRAFSSSASESEYVYTIYIVVLQREAYMFSVRSERISASTLRNVVFNIDVYARLRRRFA